MAAWTSLLTKETPSESSIQWRVVHKEEMVRSDPVRRKKEEYRKIKKYYETRFESVFGRCVFGPDTECPKKETMFRNGYSKPSFIAMCKLRIGEGKAEWGAEERKEYYILEILKITTDLT